MILFELLPRKSNLQRNTGPTLLEILACRQQKWKQKIASPRKHSTKQEKPQGATCFQVPVAQEPFYSFWLLPAENKIILNIIFPYRGLLEIIFSFKSLVEVKLIY